ncbi:MAG: DUF1080 domain-containing protein [Verrucomicrobiota bacterium]|nr:DUF1080 domain-containing protein [Verrucomicrobiota bacterium]
MIAADEKSLGYQDTPIIPGTRWHVHDGTRPQPKVVTPGAPGTGQKPGTAPSDAVILFDGTNLDQWRGSKGDGPAEWKVEAGYFEVVKGKGDIMTKQEFGPDVQLHVEWQAPAPPQGTGQARGNSGIFFYGRYEVQVLDSFENQTYPDGQAAAIYGYLPPLVNACRRPGEWQSYDIIFNGPRFKDGKLVNPAYITNFHNGVLVQNHSAYSGATGHKTVASYQPHGEKGAIRLQDHKDPVRFRNFWIRELKPVDTQ